MREYLSLKIQDWVQQHPSETMLSLAEKASLSVSTLRRIEKMEVNATLENAVQLLKVVASLEEADDFLRTRLKKPNEADDALHLFRSDFRKEIRRWLDLHPKANLQVLSRQSGVSYSTLRRIEAREVTASLEHTLQLWSVLGSVEDAKVFLRKHFPDIAFLLREEPQAGAQRAVQSREEFLIQSYAEARCGIRLVEAKRLVGDRAPVVLDGMLRDGLLREAADGFLAISPSEKPSDERALQWVLESFDPRSWDGWGSFCRLRTKGMNEAGVRAVHLILNQAAQKIDAILEDPGFFGDAFFAVGLSSSFLAFEDVEPGIYLS